MRLLVHAVESGLCNAVRVQLKRYGPVEFREAETAPPAATFDVALIAVRTADSADQAIALGRRLRAAQPGVPLILIAEHSSEELAIAALQAGFDEYLRAPVSTGDVLARLAHLWGDGSRSDHNQLAGGELLVGSSPQLRDVKHWIANVAPAETTTLITGETGTGKELVAELIHRNSPRSGRPLVRLNCAAIPDALLESELFGFERGAFTGAHAASAGKLAEAHGGTIFLDEVGDMSLYTQAKVLRAIETREIQPLGGGRTVPVDVRIVAATNQDLERLTAEGRFRRDLFYRLNVARIRVPALRDRKADIPELAAHYLQVLGRQLRHRVAGFDSAAMDALMAYDWPGNIRELKNVVEAVLVGRPPAYIPAECLPPELRPETAAVPSSERDDILRALLATNWNKSKAAEQLQWSRMTLYRKIAKYRLAALEETVTGACA